MSVNIFPRYKNNSVSEFTTTSFLQSHQPELLPIISEEQTKALTEHGNNHNHQVSLHGQLGQEVQAASKSRESGLIASPNMLLTGHTDEVFSCQFSHNGKFVATGGMDKQIFLWDVYSGCINTGVLSQFKNAVTQLKFNSDDSKLVASSADSNVSYFDLETQSKERSFKGHNSYVNCVDFSRKGEDFVLSGGNDRCLLLWDPREKGFIQKFETQFQVLSVCFANNHTGFYSSGVEDEIKVWDIRKEKPVSEIKGHSNSVTSLSVSHDGFFLLSNSADQSLRVWDLRPFAVSKSALKVYKGHFHGQEKNLLRSSWNSNGRLVASGSSDKSVIIWDTNTRETLLVLGGHDGVVNEVAFSPVADLIVSASSDKTVIISELPKLY